MHTRVAIGRSAGVVLLAAMAACTGGSPGAPSLAASGAGPIESPAGVPSLAASPSVHAATLLPTPPPESSATPAPASPAVTLPAEPPIAMLSDLTGGPVAGDLGTASWGGTTSDAPWVIGGAAGRAMSGTTLTITFDPAIRPTSWQARWAPVEGREAGAPQDAGSGTSEVISVVTPGKAGDWSLQIEARFGADSNGVWYWRVRVAR